MAEAPDSTASARGHAAARSLDEALGLCTFCPSLCRHACPVATAEGSDTVSPWGMMSLARHVRAGKVAPDRSVYSVLAACNACGACTDACQLDNPVADSLVQVRAELVQRHPELAANTTEQRKALHDAAAFEAMLAPSGNGRRRYEERPAVSLVPGPAGVPTAVNVLLSLCERLDVEVACGELARVDLGFEAWHAGDHAAFREHARRAQAAAAGARDVVVMSAESLYLLKVVYPRFGFPIGAALMHHSEMLLPLLSGAVVRRVKGRIGYHESCHLARHLGITDVPRQVLRRVIDGPLLELPRRADLTGCCGGSGRNAVSGARAGGTTERMADDIVAAARAMELERIVSFSPECVLALQRALARSEGAPLRVDNAVTLVAEAVVGDGAAA